MTSQATDNETFQAVASLMDPPRQVALREAVVERIELHPQAHVHDIMAMLEFDGIHAPVELVQEIVDQRRSPRQSGLGAWHAPPAVQRL